MPIDKLFGEFLSSPSGKGALGGAASGAVVSMLMHRKTRKKLGQSALQLGGAAALAGVGYMAYRKWQESRGLKTGGAVPAASPAHAASAPAAASAPVLRVGDPPLSSLASRMALTMMAAAQADGTVDGEELDRLVEFIDGAALPAAEKAHLTAALNAPPPLETVAALPANLEEASELYAAALGAIDPDTPAEHLFLRRLARAYGLDEMLVDSIHDTARQETPLG